MKQPMYKVGDRVRVGDRIGIVEGRTLFSNNYLMNTYFVRFEDGTGQYFKTDEMALIWEWED